MSDEAVFGDDARTQPEGRPQSERGPEDQSVAAEEKPESHRGESEFQRERAKERPRGIRGVPERAEEPDGVTEERERESEAGNVG